jgi:hypothetical protein
MVDSGRDEMPDAGNVVFVFVRDMRVDEDVELDTVLVRDKPAVGSFNRDGEPFGSASPKYPPAPPVPVCRTGDWG